MFKQRLIYRLLLIFLIFALIIIIPLSLTVRKEVNELIAEKESLGTMNPEEKKIHNRISTELTDSLIVFSFYTVVLAIFLSLFFSRNLLKPIKELYKGAKSIKEGDLGVRLEVMTDDELGEVTKSFNEMASALQEKTDELKKKEIYVSSMMDPIWVVSENNIVTDINQAFIKLFGYERDEMLGASIYDFLDEENSKIMAHQLEEREKGVSSTYEISLVAKNGSLIPVLIAGTPIIKNGVVVEKIGLFKDFRREHEFRNEIKKSRDYLETIMDSIDDELLVVDRDLKIVMANRAVKTKKGAGVIGEYCYAVSHGSVSPCWREGEDCPAKRVFDSGRISRTVHQHRSAGGKKTFFEIAAYPIKDPKGAVIHVIELMRDITERKEYEENIAQKNKELTVINSISGILSKSLKAEDIFGSVLDKLLEMITMDGGGIFLLDDANKELSCVFYKGISEEFIKIAGRMRLGEDIPGKVAATGQPMTSSDISSDHRVERSILKHSGIKGYCAIPIKGKERIVGIYCLISFRPHVFSAEEERLMTSIGEMTGIAIENIRLYEKMRQLYEYHRQRRADDHKNLLSLSSRLAASLDIKTVITSTLDLIKGIFRADLVWLLERHNENLILKADAGLNLKEGDLIYQKETSSIEWYAIEKREPVIVPAISSETKFYMSDHIAKYRSAVCFPVFVGDKALGTLTLYYTLTKELKEDDIYFIQIFSSILAVSLERSELYEKTLLEREMSDTILQSISDGILTVDNDCKIVSMNKAASEMIGITLKKATGKQCCDIFNYTDKNTDFRWSLGDCLDRALEKKSANLEAELMTTDGRQIHVLISSSPIINHKGEVTGVVHVLRNITKEKEVDRMKTEFVKTVSHQFRTPLAAIVGMTEMVINKDIAGEKATEYLRTVHTEGVRLSEMVGDLLNIARIESGRETFKEEALDFELLFEDIKKLFSSAIERKKINLIIVIDKNTNGFAGDKEKLFQLIKNLIDNSITYSDEGCEIKVTVERKHDDLEIRISDDGWGISKEDIPHLAERFFRGKNAQKAKGTGLGLALCKEIMVKQGGSMAFDSELGKGTAVTVRFPFRRK